MTRTALLPVLPIVAHDDARGVEPPTLSPSFFRSDPLVDSFARAVTYARISVTDRCNLRCVYCMPEQGNRFVAESALLSADEIVRLASILNRLGVGKIRITGGEPTTRKDLPEIVRGLGRLDLPGGLALSTNGVLFAPMARELFEAGLDRVNISLDALTDDGFRLMSRRSQLGEAFGAVEAALALPFRSVKLNAVIIRGYNEAEIPALVELARRRPIEVRFIEFMPFGNNEWKQSHLIGAAEIHASIEATGERLLPVPKGDFPGPAEIWAGEGWVGRVGFITPISDRFCARCNRLRVTADGRIKACLFGLDDVDLLSPIRSGAGDDDLVAILREAVWRKEERHPLSPSMQKDGLLLHDRNMNQIGG